MVISPKENTSEYPSSTKIGYKIAPSAKIVTPDPPVSAVKNAHSNTTINTVEPGSHPSEVLKKSKRRLEMLLSARRYPANVNMGIAANVGETTIRYALSLMVAIKSKFVAQSVGSDKKNNIERVARTTKIGKPNATSVRVAKTLNVKRISFENGNCQ